jgi:hypothetical protein
MWNLSLWYIAMLLKPDKDKEGGGAYPKKSYWHLDPQEVCKSSILKLPPPILKTKLITNKFVKSRLDKCIQNLAYF